MDAIIAAVAAHFGVSAAEIVNRHHRGSTRPLAADVLVYLARILRAQTIAATANELDIPKDRVWAVCHRFRHRRTVDPDFDRTLRVIEMELGAP